MGQNVRRKGVQQLRAVARVPSRPVSTVDVAPSRTVPNGRFSAAVTRVLSAGGSQLAEERILTAAVSKRPTSPHVVAFVAGKGGVGTTATAAGVALALAELWPLKVALGDTRTGTASLGHWLLGAPVQDATSFASGIVELTRPTGVTIVDSAPWDAPLNRPTLARLITDLREDHLFTVLDVGHDGTDIGHAAMARADSVVVVTTATPNALVGVERTLDRLRAIDEASARSAIVAVVGTRGLGRRRAIRHRVRLADVETVVHVPWDPAFDATEVFDIGRLRRATRLAYLRLAALSTALVTAGKKSD